MKTWALILVFGPLSVLAQGAFQNLDFEQAMVPVVPPNQSVNSIALTNTLPGWTGYYDTNQGQFGTYNNVFNSSRNIGLVDGHTSFYSNSVLEGYFTAVLQAGNINPPPDYGSAGIGQTGLIPSSAHALLFDIQMLEGLTSNVVFTLNGIPTPFRQISAGQNFIIYGVDISAFAGQTTEIRFTAQPALNYPDPYTSFFLDNIRFSNVSIPEPVGIPLFALGGVLLILYRLLRLKARLAR